ncbi:MAG: hypothetical protein WCJ55_10025 [Chloroflexales bacterium]
MSEIREQISGLMQLLCSDSWDAARELIAAHQQALCSPEADAPLVLLRQSFQGDPEAAAIIDEHRQLLNRCRAVGVEQAFAEIAPDTPKAALRPEHEHALDAMQAQASAMLGLRSQDMEAIAHLGEQLLNQHPELAAMFGPLAEAFSAGGDLSEVSEQLFDDQPEMRDAVARSLGEIYEHSPDLLQPFMAQFDQSLAGKLLAFIATPTWGESYDYLEAHPELLGSAALAEIDTLIVQARDHGHDDMVEAFAQHRALLERCVEVGADRAYSEFFGRSDDELIELLKGLFDRPDWPTRKAFVIANPGLLSPAIDRGLTLMIAHAEEIRDERARQSMEECRYLLRRCIEVGVDAAFAEISHDIARDMISRLVEWMGLVTWQQCYTGLDQNRDFLEPEAAQQLNELLESERFAQHDHNVAVIALHHRLLRRCADIGVAAAFAEQTGVEATIPALFVSAVGVARDAERICLLQPAQQQRQEVINCWRVIGDHPEFAAAPAPFQVAVLRRLIEAYASFSETVGGEVGALHAAADLAALAADKSPPQSSAQAELLMRRGALLRTCYGLSHERNDIDASITTFRKANEYAATAEEHAVPTRAGLAAALYERFSGYTKSLADLDEAIRLYDAVSGMLPPTSDERRAYLLQLSAALSDRFTATNDYADLKRSVECQLAAGMA